MLNVSLMDGTGTKRRAKINGDQGIYTSVLPFPPLVVQKTKPFRQYLTTDGLPGGSNDMGVDGSLTAVDFFVPSDDEKDRYITNLSFIVGYGASGSPYQWANGTPLTNGSRLFYTNIDGEQNIHEAIKTNQDLFRLSFQLIPTAWEVRHVSAANDFGYFISMDLRGLGLPYGVKLDRGSNQRLTMRIRDNAGLDADDFDCIAYGFERFE